MGPKRLASVECKSPAVRGFYIVAMSIRVSGGVDVHHDCFVEVGLIWVRPPPLGSPVKR